MEKLLCSFFFCILLLSFKAQSQEVEDERAFDYESDGIKGPTHWGELRPEWHACKAGLMQSPIDMLHERVEVISHLGDLKINYKPSNATLKNRGHDMMMKWVEGGGFMEVNGMQYKLKQCHWHSPSEHTIDGKKFDLEAHLVHESSNGMVSVIGILYQIGEPDYFLSTIKDHLEVVSGSHEEERIIGVIDPTLIKIGSKRYYRYMGSLTVPPCTESVMWTMIHEVRTVTEEQVKLLRVAVHDDSDTNARPLQPIYDRKTQLQKPKESEV
ncbi:alpha carbonic anhydrase 7-like [Cucurbita moschata]|uniref:Carbonic anhydrase n=1 Tax=Cucurbita moschata TaxID=3662 RepID=A0A6J1HPL0_CUCMO|nr:alpha carbonic anhydrase 7-like [Cucurbita moschata]